MSKKTIVQYGSLRPLLHRVNHAQKDIRQAALREYQDLEQAEKVELARMAYREAQQQRENYAGWWLAASVVFLVLGMRLFDLAFSTCVAISAIVGFVLSRFVENSIERDTMLELIDQVQEVEFLPFALVQLQSGQREGKRPRQLQGGRNLRNAALRLLPQLQEADLGDWNRAEREAFLAPLNRPFEDVELTLAVLGAVRHVGTETALQAVKRLVEMSPSMILSNLPPSYAAPDFEANRLLIQEAARECLPDLEVAVARQKQAKTLLRASEARTPAESGTLLRATVGVDQTPTEQLLRVQGE
jgi:hypothetical protein